MQNNKTPFIYLNIIFSFGYFMLCFTRFDIHVGAHVFDGGIYSFITGFILALLSNPWQNASYFISLIPNLNYIIPIAFYAVLACTLVFKFPVKNSSLANIISDESKFDQIPFKILFYANFVVGFGAFWLLPVFFEYINAIGII